MSFRLADLKKSVRKGKEGHQVTPVRLESRQHAFRIDFVLQQFEEHLGKPRRTLDPDVLLDFLGDSRIGRGLLATLAQWYRMRPRTFAEVLDRGGADWRETFREEGIDTVPDLRAWLFAAVNQADHGFLSPEREATFWEAHASALGLRRKDLERLVVLDRPEEAILVRSGPAPAAADVMNAYNARAHTTLLRAAQEVTLRCAAPAGLVRRAAEVWAGAEGVAARTEGDTLTLLGAADALGSWSRQGRRLERATLELLALSDLRVREARGVLDVSGRRCSFHWKPDVLAALGAGQGAPLDDLLPSRAATLAASLRRERDAVGPPRCSIRRPAHLVGDAREVCWPHLELRVGDRACFLRLGDGSVATDVRWPSATVPLVRVALAGGDGAWTFRRRDDAEVTGSPRELLCWVAEWLLEQQPEYLATGSPQALAA